MAGTSAAFDFKEFMAGLKAAEPFLQAEGLLVIRATGEEVVAVAKALAPVDTDALQQDIKVEASGIDARGAFVDVGTTEPYALYQEFGTSHNPAHPFMRPAIAQVTGQGSLSAGGFASRLALKRKPRIKKK